MNTIARGPVRRSGRCLALSVALASFVGLACSSEPDDAADPGPVHSILAALPDTDRSLDRTVFVLAGDIERASGLISLEVPAVDQASAVDDWLAALDAQPSSGIRWPLMFHLRSAEDFTEMHDDLGWTPLEATWFAEVQDIPEKSSVFRTGLSDERLASALGEAVDGVYALGSRTDGERERRSSAARPVGDPIRLVVKEGLLLVTVSTPAATSWSSGESESVIARIPGLAAVADALDAAQVHAVQIAGPAGSQISPAVDVVAVGVGSDDRGLFGLIVHHLADPAVADDVVAAVRQSLQGPSRWFDRPWEEVVLESDVQADDDVVVTRLRFIDTDDAFGFLQYLHGPDAFAADILDNS